MCSVIHSYELQLPNSQTWAALTSFSPEGAIWFPGGFAAETGGLSLRKIDYQYSNLFDGAIEAQQSSVSKRLASPLQQAAFR